MKKGFFVRPWPTWFPGSHSGVRIPPAPKSKSPPRFLAREELDVYTQLVDLVSGQASFELTYSDEYIDGALVGLSAGYTSKLRQGRRSAGRTGIDLHGYKRAEAREVVTAFLWESFARNLRCVLVISGRGLNSRDKQPILKKGLVSWLTRSPLKRLVLAFASARSQDGGAGAVYVLLRRNPGRGRSSPRSLVPHDGIQHPLPAGTALHAAGRDRMDNSARRC